MKTANLSNEMTVARKREFSAAHFYRSKKLTEAENRATFGQCFSEHGHGHNYTVEAFISGPIDPQTRLVINIAELDHILKTALEPLEHKHLCFEVEEFKTTVPTTENIAIYLRDRIIMLLAPFMGLKLNRIRLFETADLWVEIPESEPRGRGCELTREVTVRAMHFLENSQMTPEENRALYGICYGLHGHHYKIQVTVSTALDEVTGLVFDRDRLDKILNASVIQPFDGANLNELFPNTACEALAKSLYQRLAPLFPDGVLKRIGIQETRKNYFAFPSD